jgi:hypothetical protein
VVILYRELYERIRNKSENPPINIKMDLSTTRKVVIDEGANTVVPVEVLSNDTNQVKEESKCCFYLALHKIDKELKDYQEKKTRDYCLKCIIC